MSSGNNNEKEKWYPGKFIKQRQARKKGSDSNDVDDFRHDSIESNEINSLKSFDRTNSINSTYIESTNSVKTQGSPSGIVNTGVVSNDIQIGKVTITFHTAKYLSYSRMSLMLKVDGNSQTFPNIKEEVSQDFIVSFPVYDISSSVVLLFTTTSPSDSSQTRPNFVGRVVIPLSHFIDGYKVKPAVVEWRQIYPTYKNGQSLERYRPGLEGILESAMARPKDTLGFISTTINLSFTYPIHDLYFMNLPSYKSIQSDAVEIIPTQNLDIIRARIRREDQRFITMQSFPPIINSFLSIPEVFTFIGVFFFIIYSIKDWQLPLLLLGVVFYNGRLYNSQRNFNSYIIWNDPVVENRASLAQTSNSNPNDSSTININMAISLDALRSRLKTVATKLEKWTNLWSFGDNSISKIAYSFSLKLAVLLSLVSFIVGFRIIIFILIAFTAFIFASKDIIKEILDTVTTNEYLQTVDKKVASSKTIGAIIGKNVRKMRNFWSRVPDDNELFHR